MALHLRQRGEIWHARGTIRIGSESVEIASFSTGCRSRVDAEAVAGAEEARIRRERLEGGAGRSRNLTVADCFLSYLQRPGGVGNYEKTMIGRMNGVAGSYAILDAADAWSAWLGKQSAVKSSTAARWRAVFVAALRSGCGAMKVSPVPEIPAVHQRREQRVASLQGAERAALLRAYHPVSACPILLLAYAGLRTQEALRLDWRDVDFAGRRLLIRITKSGRLRTVPTHRRVDALLFGMWHAAGRPSSGPVFLSIRGKPYQDTRGLGGNPLKRAHQAACLRAGVAGFRVHDWRHDFALRFLSEGGDIRSLMQIMGWSTIHMAERYVTYRVEHLARVLDRIA